MSMQDTVEKNLKRLDELLFVSGNKMGAVRSILENVYEDGYGEGYSSNKNKLLSAASTIGEAASNMFSGLEDMNKKSLLITFNLLFNKLCDEFRDCETDRDFDKKIEDVCNNPKYIKMINTKKYGAGALATLYTAAVFTSNYIRDDIYTDLVYAKSIENNSSVSGYKINCIIPKKDAVGIIQTRLDNKVIEVFDKTNEAAII